MNKVRNLIFSVSLAIFLLGPAALWVSQTKLHLDIPSWLTAEDATYLSGSKQETSVRESLSVEKFQVKELQGAIEHKLSNYIPAKAMAITENAAIQRHSIVLSNFLFNWPCYPTYYGSTRLTYPMQSVIAYLPKTQSASYQNQWRTFATGLCKAARRHPEKRFVVYVAGGYYEPSINPAYSLMSRPVRPTDCIDLLRNETAAIPNIFILGSSYESEEQYYEDFFRTDHHWNINGAMRAYGEMANALGLEKISSCGTSVIPGYLFTGSTARFGIDLLEEEVFDCNNTFSYLTARRSNGVEQSGANHSSFYNADPLLKHYCFYDIYYDNLGDCVISGGSGNRSALLASNSFRGAIQRPLASSYQSLSVNKQLHPSATVTETLDEQIERAGADDIFFIANPSNLKVSDEKYWGQVPLN